MTKRKYDPDRLIQAAAAWDVHHALVAAARRLVKLSGGVQEAKDVVDAVADADVFGEVKEEARSAAPPGVAARRAPPLPPSEMDGPVAAPAPEVPR